MSYELFATTPLEMEGLLADELRALGAEDVTPARAGASFRGQLEVAYRVCLWSRIASRVLLQLEKFHADGPEALYEGVRSMPWEDHLDPDGTLSVDFNSSDSAIRHTNFGALKTKDAIVDRLRELTGRRPSVDGKNPDVRVNVHLRHDEATVSIDLSGDALHRRGWRTEGGGRAPLKEGLACAVLLHADWPAAAAEGRPLLDLMCGAGTMPIEAALMAADVAPGLLRRKFGFHGWLGHIPKMWERLLEEARQRDRRSDERRASLPRITGFDADPSAVRGAIANVERAGLRGLVHIERRPLQESAPVSDEGGVLVVNPPYGERLGTYADLELLYRQLGDHLKARFGGWTAHVLTGDPTLARFVGLKAQRRTVLWNGAIECRLLRYPMQAPRGEVVIDPLSGPVSAFANRLKKNLRKLEPWARKKGVTCYRIYDADIPEYAIRVDRYENWLHVMEDERPKTVDPVKAVKRLNDALTALKHILGVTDKQVFVKQRRRLRGDDQYQREQSRARMREVHEGGHRFWVNPSDYHDTGLFLDHRDVRAELQKLAHGRRFLNLFAYTGSATVYAARGGAASTTTVDLSKTYLEWARQNLELNGITGDRHRIVRMDCLRFLERERGRFGLIFLDPPSFSNSKAMDRTLDIQRDHVELLRATTRLLDDDGVLIFSNNRRGFRMAEDTLSELEIRNITKPTLPTDFARSPRIHNVWRIAKR